MNLGKIWLSSMVVLIGSQNWWLGGCVDSSSLYLLVAEVVEFAASIFRVRPPRKFYKILRTIFSLGIGVQQMGRRRCWRILPICFL